MNKSKRRAFDAIVRRFPGCLGLRDFELSQPGFRSLWCVRVDQDWEWDCAQNKLSPPATPPKWTDDEFEELIGGAEFVFWVCPIGCRGLVDWEDGEATCGECGCTS